MRILNGLLAVVLAGFAAVQANDPDATFWMVAYGVPAAWTLLAAAAPGALATRPAPLLLSLTVAAAAAGVVRFWPEAPGWWRMEVWWQAEAAREGMGMMIVLLSLLAPVASLLAERSRGRLDRPV